MAISVLFLYTSNQIGSTYGEYNTSQKQDIPIELCKVFPGQIEQLLQEFGGHIKRITELKASLSSYPVTAGFGGSAGIEGLSLDELDSAAQQVSEQISAAGAEINALDGQLGFNAGVWLEIMQEVASAAGILAQIGGYMVNLEPNCLEIRDAQFFEELQSSINQSGVLSESLVETLNGILNYLTSIHEIGGTLPSGNPGGITRDLGNLSFFSQEPILSFMARAYTPQVEVSDELRFAYEQLNTEMNDAKNTLSSEIVSLRNQQVQIAETKAKLLEQARKEEEERLEKEKKKQEEAAEKAKEEAKDPKEDKPKDDKPKEDKPKDDKPPAEDTDPQDKNEIGGPAHETPVPETAPPAASPAPGNPVDPTAAEPAPEKPAAEQPSATPAPTEAPVSSEAPAASSDPDPIKGGD